MGVGAVKTPSRGSKNSKVPRYIVAGKGYMTLPQISKAFHIRHTIFRHRLWRGISITDALFGCSKKGYFVDNIHFMNLEELSNFYKVPQYYIARYMGAGGTAGMAINSYYSRRRKKRGRRKSAPKVVNIEHAEDAASYLNVPLSWVKKKLAIGYTPAHIVESRDELLIKVNGAYFTSRNGACSAFNVSYPAVYKVMNEQGAPFVEAFNLIYSEQLQYVNITYKGREYTTLMLMCKHTGLEYRNITRYIARGMSIEEAIAHEEKYGIKKGGY